MARRSTTARIRELQSDTLQNLAQCVSENTVGQYEATQEARRMRDMEVSRRFSHPAVHPSTVVRDIVSEYCRHNAAFADADGNMEWNARPIGRSLLRVDLELAAVQIVTCCRCRLRMPYWQILVCLNCPGGGGKPCRDHVLSPTEAAESPVRLPPPLLQRIPHSRELDVFLRLFRVVPTLLANHAADMVARKARPSSYEAATANALRAPIRAYASFQDLFDAPFCVVPPGIALLDGVAPFISIGDDWIIDMVHVYTHYILPAVDITDVAELVDIDNVQTQLRRAIGDDDGAIDDDNANYNAAADTLGSSGIVTVRPDDLRNANADLDFPLSSMLGTAYDDGHSSGHDYARRTVRATAEYGMPASHFETVEPIVPIVADRARFIPFAIYARTTDILENKARLLWGRGKYTEQQCARRRRKRQENADMARLLRSLVTKGDM